MREMISAIIVDDEQHCIDRLTALLQQGFTQDVVVMAACKTIAEAADAIQLLKPRLVFLDVQVHDETGFDLLKQLPSINFAVIFTTAYEKYAVQAFKFSAVDYLLKPVDTDDLKAAVEKAKSAVAAKDTATKMDALLYNIQQMGNAARRICIPVSTGLIFIQVSDIIRCESDINYTTLYLKDKKKVVAAKTLKEFEEMLADYNFYRVHNSHLVNMAYITGYNKSKGGGGMVVMSDGSEAEVSTRRKEEFLKRMTGEGIK